MPRPLCLAAHVRRNPLAGGARRQLLGRRRVVLLASSRRRSIGARGAAAVHGSTAGRKVSGGRRASRGLTRGFLGRLSLAPAGLAAGEIETRRAAGRGRGAVLRVGALHGATPRGGGLRGFSLTPAAGANRGRSLAAAVAKRLSAAQRTFLLGLAASESLLFAALLKGCLLKHLLALLVALLLELGELGLAGLLALALLLFLASGILLGFAQFSLLLFAFTLLAQLAIAEFLLAKGDLLLKLLLGITATLLEFVTAALMQVLLEGFIGRDQSGQAVLELDVGLVQLLGILELLGGVLIIDGTIMLALLLVVLGHLLGFLLAVGTLQMIDTLASDSELFLDVMLFTLKLAQLNFTETVCVQVVNITQVNVETLAVHFEFLDLLLDLGPANLVALLFEASGLTFSLVILQTLVLGLLESLLLQTLLAGILLVLAGLSLGGFLLALRDDVLTGKNSQVFLFSSSLGTAEGGIAGRQTFFVELGIDVVASREEGPSKASELRSDNLRGCALETLNSTAIGLGGTSGGAAVASLGRREDVAIKAQHPCSMVHADGEVALLVTVHDELFNGGTGNLERLRKLGKSLDKLKINGIVDLRKLLEQAGENDLLQREDVALHLSVSANLAQNGRDFLANGQRVEINLKNVIKLLDLRANTLKKRLGQRITEETGTSRSLGHAKQVINHGTTRARGADDGNGEGRQKDERGSLLKISLGGRRVVSLLALTGGNKNSRVAKEVIVSGPSSGVEQVVLTNEKDAGELFVVIGHHDVLGGTLAKVEQSVNVLDAAEGLLPEFKLNSNIQLLEAGLEMALQSVGIVEVDSMHL
ncbi:hypothetical protein HC256_004871 [Beauveria bassiana]|nr:hypothetical protein HC256_004871 [Beauveria bassiana]